MIYSIYICFLAVYISYNISSYDIICIHYRHEHINRDFPLNTVKCIMVRW